MSGSDGVVLGIDAGGSKTLALVAGLDGVVRGRARSGAGNYHAVGFAAASSAITDAAREALRSAGCEASEVRAVCLGAAGVDRPDDRALWTEWARQAFPDAKARIVNDALIVLAAATAGDCCGLAVIAGTGSIVYGRDARGETSRAGGWGYLMGDEGSNFSIGQAALRAVTRAADGRAQPTGLTPALLEHWELKQPSDLVAKVYGDTNRKDISRLGRLVEAVAETGDEVARRILEEAGQELAVAANAVVRRLDLKDDISCALAGAVLTRGERVRGSLLRHAQQAGLQLDPVVLVEEPAYGAVELAIETVLREST